MKYTVVVETLDNEWDLKEFANYTTGECSNILANTPEEALEKNVHTLTDNILEKYYVDRNIYVIPETSNSIYGPYRVRQVSKPRYEIVK